MREIVEAEGECSRIKAHKEQKRPRSPKGVRETRGELQAESRAETN